MKSIETIELEVQLFWSSIIVDEEMLTNSEIRLRHMLENLAYGLTVLHKTAAQTLQRDEQVAKWPASRWDNFLVAIGLDKYAKFRALKFTEMLTFPTIKLPPLEKIRIFTQQTIGDASV